MRIFWLAVVLLLQFPLWMHISKAYTDEQPTASSQMELNLASVAAPRPMQTAVFHEDIKPAAEQLFKYINFIKGKRIGLVVNQTSTIGTTHLVDTLLQLGCNIQKIFAPEHGFRGKADRGEHIKDGKDPGTGVKIVSLYGKNLRPGADLMQDIDLVIFDIQDVGVRFYTFTSTMTYMMEACAEFKIPMLVLDRPNPLGHVVDGPLMEKDWKSFVGLHPVPIIHGLTTAEYARMINGEGWLRDSLKCELYHVECLNYDHHKFYKLPIKPSPNLPNMHSIYLYPSLCLFEGTTVSMGRGTDKQFQVYGHPDFKKGNYTFVPKPGEGDKNPVHNGKSCQGYDLSTLDENTLQKELSFNLSFLIQYYRDADSELKASFFNKDDFFHKLAGNNRLRADIIAGKSEAEIRKSWQKDLDAYKALRKKYLLYKE